MGASWCGCSPEEPSAGRGLPQPHEKQPAGAEGSVKCPGFVEENKRHVSTSAGRKDAAAVQNGNERVGGARKGTCEGEALREAWQLDAVQYFTKERPIDRVQAYVLGENAVRRGSAMLSPVPNNLEYAKKGEGVLSEPTTDTGRLTSEPSEAEYARMVRAVIARGSDGCAAGSERSSRPAAGTSAATANSHSRTHSASVTDIKCTGLGEARQQFRKARVGKDDVSTGNKPQKAVARKMSTATIKKPGKSRPPPVAAAPKASCMRGALQRDKR
eukprot:TRINITY_DN5199_c0_g1_i4.p2 TRINITY_DN5199_c0_g1~~TRINITY_DN5199_c0_g1_i4.p2  ORF type:complete len:272 (+),score=52.62 TRINITY_DN5199_c0_g1_i4:67-882(+)